MRTILSFPTWTRGAAVAAALVLAGCEKLPNVPPTATFIFSPVAPIIAGQTAVVFNAAGSHDTDGHVTTYVWNFGDGTPEQRVSSPTLSHVFPDTGASCVEITYAVFLVVMDDGGESGSFSQNVKVIESPAPSTQECLRR